MELKKVPVSTLHEEPENERGHPDDNRSVIRSSIEKFGQVEPLIVRKGANRVIHGNGRLRVLREMGVKEVWITEFDGTDEEAAALRIVMNRAAELAQWDMGALHKSLEGLRSNSFNISEIGFTMPDFQKIKVSAHERAPSWDEAARKLSKDEPGFHSVTFVLTTSEREAISAEISRAKKDYPKGTKDGTVLHGLVCRETR